MEPVDCKENKPHYELWPIANLTPEEKAVAKGKKNKKESDTMNDVEQKYSRVIDTVTQDFEEYPEST